MITNQEFVSLAEAAQRLGVHVSTVRDWVRLGRVPAYRVGHRFVRLRWDELLAALRGHAHDKALGDKEGEHVQ